MGRELLVCLSIAAGTVLSYVGGLGAGIPALVPVLNTVPAFPWMVASLRRGRPGQAIGRMLVWAAVMAVCATLLAYLVTDEAERLFLNATAYRREMFRWVRTGEGIESDAARFVPQHLAHAAIFCALSVSSGSLLSMPMGAALMNYMGHYVGALAATDARPLAVALLAWHPWSLVRIVAFVILGVTLAGPLLSRLLRFEYRLADQRRLLAVAAAGLVLDIALKWALAPSWAPLLRRVAGWPP